LRKSGEYQKGDERILGDGAFVKEVLARAEERLKDKYRLKAEGYDMDKIISRVSEIIGISPAQILDNQRDKKRTEARSIVCFWAKDQLGISQSQLAQSFHQTQSAISYAVRRGRILVEKNSYSLSDS
jgi:putative transposase